MARKPETTYRTSVERHLDSCVAREKTNNPYRAGIPDVYYEGDKRALWVEYKWFPRTPEKVNLLDFKKKPHVTRLQQEWLVRAAKNGQRVAVIAGTPGGGIILPGLAWNSAFRAGPEHFLTPRGVAAWIHRQTMWQASLRSKLPTKS